MIQMNKTGQSKSTHVIKLISVTASDRYDVTVNWS